MPCSDISVNTSQVEVCSLDVFSVSTDTMHVLLSFECCPIPDAIDT